MSQSVQSPAEVLNAFHHLVKELHPFIRVDDLRIAFDYEFNAYVLGEDFQEQVDRNLRIHREIRENIRMLIAKHRSKQAD